MRGIAPGILVLALAMPAGDVAGQAPGEKLVYTSVNPCRIVDTRPTTAGALAPGVPRTFHVVGTASDFVAQGGTAGGCGVPGFAGPGAQVRAVVVNFVAVAAQGSGNLRAWASDQTAPNASIINYAQVPGLNIANAVVVPVRQDAEGADITVRADGAGTHVVADVAGYFSPLGLSSAETLRFLRGVVNPNGTVAQGTGFTASRLGVGQYRILFTTPLAFYPAAVVTPFTGTPAFARVSGLGGGVAFVNIENPAGAPVDVGFSFVVMGPLP